MTAPLDPKAIPKPAFPCGSLHEGLTKRELFAAMMAQSLRRALPDETPGQIASWAIADADALLRELNR